MKMKKYLFLLAVLAVCNNNAQAIDISGSSLEYTAKFSDVENYADKDGEVEFQVNFDNFKLKYSSDIKNNKSDTDTTLDLTYSNDLDKKTSYQIKAKLDTSTGTGFFIDTESDDTYLKHRVNNSFDLTFYPFNSISSVGNELETTEVAEINYFTEKYTNISGTSDAELGNKTLPGIQTKYTFDKINSAYLTVGAVTYDAPVDFDLETSTMPSQWQSRVDIGYKVGYTYDNELTIVKVEYASHTDSEEAGSLLESAGAVEVTQEFNNLVFEFEAVYSKAGSNPYYLDGNEFAQLSTYEPVYKQDWVGEADFGAYAKVSYEVNQNLFPFITFNHYGEKFIYDGENSAHKLRTGYEGDQGFNDSDSHGGLSVVKLGAKYQYKEMSITPFYEYKQAGNAVFTPEDDLTAKSELRTDDLVDTAYVAGINVKFEF